jgi:hypothetical protein
MADIAIKYNDGQCQEGCGRQEHGQEEHGQEERRQEGNVEGEGRAGRLSTDAI